MVASERWAERKRGLEFIDACEKRWRASSSGGLSTSQAQWLEWARAEASQFGPWDEGYPEPISDGFFDSAAIPLDGPYPQTRTLKANEPGNSPPPQEVKPPAPPSHAGYQWQPYSRY